MNSQQSQYKSLVEALLPKDLFQYFEISEVKITEKEIQINLDELNNPTSLTQKRKLLSIGFHAPIIIQGFPIREQTVFLHVRKRKWKEERTGKIISNSWDIIAKGTRWK